MTFHARMRAFARVVGERLPMPRKRKPVPTPTPEPTPVAQEPPNLPPYTAIESEGQRWHNYGVTPSLTLIPVALTAEEVTALEYAASQWNDTGYFRLFIGQGIPAAPSVFPYGEIPVFNDAPNLGYGGCNGPGEWAVEGSIHIGLGTVYKKHIFTHEAGHVLGLSHTDEYSVMGNWTLGGPVAIDIAALARKYFYNTGPVTVPAGCTYPTGIARDVSLVPESNR